METVRLGRTNLQVGEIGVGCWAIGGPFVNLGLAGGWDSADDKEAKEGLLEAVEMGANLFDTADVYGFGRSERLVGWMLRKVAEAGLAGRDQLTIATKVGYFQGCSEHPYLPLHMRHQLEMSLHNLGTDYVDIYWFHHLDFGEKEQYLEGTIEEMRRFREEGHIRFIGLRGPHKFSPKRHERAPDGKDPLNHFFRMAEIIDPDVITLRYNVLSPKYDSQESDVFEWAENRDLGVLVYKPLAQGLLLDKYDPDKPPVFGPGDHRIRKRWFQREALSVLKRRLAVVKREFDCVTTSDLMSLFIKYCLSRTRNMCVLVGFRNAQQLRESLSVGGRLTKRQCLRLREIFRGIGEEIGEFVVTKRGDQHA